MVKGWLKLFACLPLITGFLLAKTFGRNGILLCLSASRCDGTRFPWLQQSGHKN